MTTENTSIVSTTTDGWCAEGLRFTAFSSVPADIHQAETWWTEVAKSSPEQVSRRLGDNSVHVEGVFDGHKLLLSMNPGRIDWHLVASESDLQDAPMVSIGRYRDSSPRFCATLQTWLRDNAAWKRLAYGAVTYLPAASKEDGYSLLDKRLPAFHIGGAGELSDFMLQLNRPRASRTGVADLQINRLSRWSVMVTQRLNMKLTLPFPGSGPITSAAPEVSQRSDPLFALRLELDINTAPSFQGAFTGRDGPEVLAELEELSAEILAHGDVP